METPDAQAVDRSPRGRRTRRTGARVVIVTGGPALVDTSARVAGAESFASRPRSQRRSRQRRRRRHSKTLHSDLLYVAVPIASGGQVHGAVRITYPTRRSSAVRRYWLILAAIRVVVLAGARSSVSASPAS